MVHFKGMDEIIDRVAARSDISRQAAQVAVDVAFTAVKERLPQQLADQFVNVMAGSAHFHTTGLSARVEETSVADDPPASSGVEDSVVAAKEAIIDQVHKASSTASRWIGGIKKKLGVDD